MFELIKLSSSPSTSSLITEASALSNNYNMREVLIALPKPPFTLLDLKRGYEIIKKLECCFDINHSEHQIIDTKRKGVHVVEISTVSESDRQILVRHYAFEFDDFFEQQCTMYLGFCSGCEHFGCGICNVIHTCSVHEDRETYCTGCGGVCSRCNSFECVECSELTAVCDKCDALACPDCARNSDHKYLDGVCELCESFCCGICSQVEYCEICEKLKCNDCCEVLLCEDCDEWICDECCSIQRCDICDKLKCAECCLILPCDICEKFKCDECDPIQCCDVCDKAKCTSCESMNFCEKSDTLKCSACMNDQL